MKYKLAIWESYFWAAILLFSREEAGVEIPTEDLPPVPMYYDRNQAPINVGAACAGVVLILLLIGVAGAVLYGLVKLAVYLNI